MIVDQSHGLHEGVSRGRTHEAPASFFEFLAQTLGSWGLSGNARFGNLFGSLTGRGFKLPEKFAQAAELFLQFQGPLSVIDGGLDLFAVPYYPSVEDQTLYVFLVEPGYLMKIEITESFSEVLSLSEDGEPGKSGLKTFQTDFFKEAPIVGNRVAPLGIVVVSVVFRLGAPPAATSTVRIFVVH